MTNSTYDNLKRIALIIAPILTFGATLLKIWDIPYSTQILATLSAIDVLVGSIVAIANEQYNKKFSDEVKIEVEKTKAKNKGKKN